MSGLTNASGQILLATPAFPAASLNLTTNTGLGIWLNSSTPIWTKGGGEIFMPDNSLGIQLNAGNPVFPSTDNSVRLGQSGTRWLHLVMKVGSLNTSHSDFKTDIQPIQYTEVPRGIQFRWKANPDRVYWGFEADHLPKEAFAYLENGEIDKTGIYTNAVIGILCDATRKLQNDVADLIKQCDKLVGA